LEGAGPGDPSVEFVLNLTDTTGSVFGRRAEIPDQLSLDHFDIAKGFVVEMHNGSTFQDAQQNYGIMFNIDSLELYDPNDGIVSSTRNPFDHWSMLSSPSVQTLDSVAWNGRQFMAVGNGVILSSSDGELWDVVHSSAIDGFRDVAWNGAIWVVVGWYGSIVTSTDGEAWANRHSGTDKRLRVAWCEDQFIAVGAGGIILTSAQGEEWEKQESGVQSDLFGIAKGGSVYVATGSDGTILTSSDGRDWTRRDAPASANLGRVRWCGDQFVVVGREGTVLTSPDGMGWMQQTSGVTGTLSDIAWDGSTMVAVGWTGLGWSSTMGTILTSTDGMTWKARHPYTPRTLRGVVAHGERFIVVGGDGVILESGQSGSLAFKLNMVSSTDGGFRLEWSGTPSRRYRVQYRQSLNDEKGWIDIGETVTAVDSLPFIELETVSTDKQRFFRVLELE
jgi:hypothetical protein